MKMSVVFCSGRPKSDSPTIEMGTYGGLGSTLGGLSKASSVPLGNSTLMSMSPSGSKSHLLRRMPRVTSDEAQATHNSSNEDCRLTQPLLQKPESPVIVSFTFLLQRWINFYPIFSFEKEDGSHWCRFASFPTTEATPPKRTRKRKTTTTRARGFNGQNGRSGNSSLFATSFSRSGSDDGWR